MNIHSETIPTRITKTGAVRHIFLRSCLILVIGFCTSPLYSQRSIHIENATLEQVLKEIGKKNDYQLFYNSGTAQNIKGISLQLNNVSINEILEQALKGTNLGYAITGKTIVIRQQTQQQQPIEITGTVTDKNKEPLVGASVVIQGTKLGVSTDLNGKFSIKVPAHTASINISYIGYESKDVAILDANPEKPQVYHIVLNEDVSQMDEVVVTGIFNKSRESFTGAVTSISAKDIKMFKGQNIISTLRNIDPSLNIVANNTAGSNPNLIPEINIRGNSSLSTSIKELNEEGKQRSELNAPLIIMDGFEISLQRLMDFNDNEIESINIMKDAAATAIYGSRGANGVIVIVTKAPVAGKLKINAQGGINIQMPDLSSYNLLNASEKLQLENQLKIYNSDEPLLNSSYQEQYNEILRDVLGGVNTYWLAKPLQTGIGQRYNVRLEGGTEDFRWGVSMGYNQIKGVMKESFRNTFDGTINLAYSFKKVTLKNQTTIILNKGQESPYGKFSEYAQMNPYWRTHDENGELIKTYRSLVPGLGNIGNPLYNAGLNSKDYSKGTEITNNFSIEWNMLDGLTLRAKLGLTKSFNTRDYFLPPGHTEFENKKYDYFQKGLYEYTTGEGMLYDGSVTLSYSKLFAEKHQLYFGFDYSIANRNSFSYTFASEGYTNDRGYLPDANLYKTGSKPNGSESTTRRVGFTGNINYTYNNRYFVDFSYRADGASQFGKQNKFAPFWSSGIGWNVHNESWLSNQEVINTLQLKGSYGQTGSLQFQAYQALTTYKDNNRDRYMYWNGASLMGFGNENLKWQVTDQMNIGTVISLFNNRVKATFDYYTKKTSNLLSERELPSASGFSSYTENIGEVKNNGFETSLSCYLIRNTSRNMIWTLTGKLAYNKNKITRLSEAIKRQNEDRMKENLEVNRLMVEGYSENSIYAVPSLGIDPSTGQEIFLDKNGEKTLVWNANALRYCGVAEPKYRGNLSSMFIYRNFTVNLSFGYQWGGQQYNSTLLNKVEITRDMARMNVDKRVFTERWQNPGDVKFFKSFYNANGDAATRTKMSSRFVMKDNMFSLQSASVQYSWKNQWIQETMGMQAIDFSCNMSDLFYTSTIKRERGTSYPFARALTFTVALQF